jgi:glyoxylase-like metal-dependent hydrolase (beta-lactamase superfamily II)
MFQRGHLTNNNLLIETEEGLVLVDTGFGLKKVANPGFRLSKFFLGMLKPDFREEMTAYRQIEALGFDPHDVQHIILTHLDFDHAGVAVKTEDKWIFNTGDAYFYHAGMNHDQPHCTPGLTFYQNMMDKDDKAPVWNQERLRELKFRHSKEIEIFCSHDVVEFERISKNSAQIPVSELSPQIKQESQLTFQE